MHQVHFIAHVQLARHPVKAVLPALSESDRNELPMNEIDAQQAPYRCPRCQRPTGIAYRVADDGGADLRVLIRCGDCRHRWSAIIGRPTK